MKLRYSADYKTLAYMFVTTALFIVQWQLDKFNIALYIWCLFMAVSVAVIAHNHNHLSIWKNKTLNILTDYWLTLFYGFPVFAWIPTHNKNHHRLNNREGDYTITYRVSEKNNLFTLLIYPSISGYYQQKAINAYLKEIKTKDKEKYFLCLSQYLILILFIGAGLIIDWQKALLYIIIPQQFSLYVVMIFNYVQHVHADEESKYNHSRNFVGFLNAMLFNNGYHTIHHDKAGLHWSVTPAAHKEIEHLIDDSLNERSMTWFMLKNYIFGIFMPSLKTQSMRLERLTQEQLAPNS
ncbi:MAG: fatty acid desaturase [Calditrichaeota bacterium]|nr:fatty acid desaturase [Calditrichota bacterium]